MHLKTFSRTALLLCICLTGFLHSGYAQRTSYTGSFSSFTVANKTCYSPAASINYTALISCSGSTCVYGTDYSFNLNNTFFKLRTTASGPGGTVLATNAGGTTGTSTISGSFDLTNLAPGMYTIDASITVVIPGTSLIVTASQSFIVGYQSVWSNLLEMTASPNSYSTKRSTTTGTYARAISANLLSAGTDGWINLGAQFGANTGTVYALIGKTITSTTIPPTAGDYILFQRTGATAGSVVVRTASTNYTLTGLTYSSRIYMARVGGTIRFYDENGVLISGSPSIASTGQLNVGVLAPTINDGISNAITSFPCVFDNQFYYLKDEVEQTMALVTAAETNLRFKFEEAYFDGTGNLSYKITCLTDDVVPTPVTVTKPAHTNWIEIPLGSGGVAFTAGNVYLLEVTDAKGRKHYLKYKKM